MRNFLPWEIGDIVQTAPVDGVSMTGRQMPETIWRNATVAVTGNTASRIIRVGGVNRRVLRAAVHKTAVRNRTAQSAFSDIGAIINFDLAVDIDEVSVLQNTADAADMVITFDGAFYREVTDTAARHHSKQSAIVITVGV